MFYKVICYHQHISADRNKIRTLQRLLQWHDVDPGPIDGIWGPKTEAAVRQALTLAADTNIPPITDIIDAYVEKTKEAVNAVLQDHYTEGTRLDVPTTQKVQSALDILEYDVGPIDGLHGPMTESAIQAFNQDIGNVGSPEPIADRPVGEPTPPATQPTRESADESPLQRVHVVERGDSLSRIAREYGIEDWREIQRLNSLDSTVIHPNQQLILPPVAETSLEEDEQSIIPVPRERPEVPAAPGQTNDASSVGEDIPTPPIRPPEMPRGVILEGNVGPEEELAPRPVIAPSLPRGQLIDTTDNPDGQSVYLTFDDGPHPVHTPRILDILDRHGAKATFFVLGDLAREHPDILRDIHNRGHEIAVHTMSHESYRRRSNEDIIADLTETADIIEEITGTRPTLSRPPNGHQSTRHRMAVGQAGFPSIMWHVDITDADRNDVDRVSHVVGRTQTGSVLLFHDNRPADARDLDAILRGLSERDYQFDRLSDNPQVTQMGRYDVIGYTNWFELRENDRDPEMADIAVTRNGEGLPEIPADLVPNRDITSAQAMESGRT